MRVIKMGRSKGCYGRIMNRRLWNPLTASYSDLSPDHFDSAFGIKLNGLRIYPVLFL
jgi:hypothetical protein